jgi:hypothetical protein
MYYDTQFSLMPLILPKNTISFFVTVHKTLYTFFKRFSLAF